VAAALTEAAAEHRDAVVARMGGDEFCVLLPHEGVEAAQALAEDASARLEAGEGVPIEISCGIAALGPEHDRPAALLRAADFSQYRAKRSNRGAPPDGRGEDQPMRSYRDWSTVRGELADELLGLLDRLEDKDADELRNALRSRLRAVSGRAFRG
jgi:GGDEF domain-containing protein